jgi:hypothetical protein
LNCHRRNLGALKRGDHCHERPQPSVIAEHRSLTVAVEQGQDNRLKAAIVTGHVWSIRAKLHLELRGRDLALFNPAIDSKLRRRDLVVLRVDDVAPQGYAIDRANVRQRETGRCGSN